MIKRNIYTLETLEPLVKESLTMAEVCKLLKLKPSTGSQTYLKKKIISLGIDLSHFKGQHWRIGLQFIKKDALKYCFNGSKTGSHILKLKLIRDGYKEKKCELCGITHWLGEEVVFELDHIDSDHFNNEFSNLQILCPNCHAMVTRKRNVRLKPNKDVVLIKSNKSQCECGELKNHKYKQCVRCAKIKQRKVDRPSYEELKQQLVESNFSALGRKYGVSDNTIRKWIKNYEKIKNKPL